jgi:hypothetical protein
VSRPATAVVPQRTKDTREAWLLLAIDGAAILETDGDWSDEGLLASVRSVLGPALRAARRPIKVRPGPPGSGPHLDWETRSVLNDSTRRQGLHVDGYGRYGAAYPDYIFLACERPAQAGGESFVVDCVKLVDDLRSDPADRELTDFLWRQPVIQCSPEGVVWQAPVARLVGGGRRTVLYNDKQHLTDPTPAQERLLAAWRYRAEQAQDAAPRFLLRSGDLLCLDNYRVAHGRDRYEDGDRLLHRLWTWSDAASGVPDPHAADAEGAARDAARDRQARATTQEALSVSGSDDRPRSSLWARRPGTTGPRR